MLELNLPIRLVAFLFLSSSCFTSLGHSIGNIGCGLTGLCYAVPRNDLDSLSLYINTNTSNLLEYNPNRIPSHDTYKKMHNRDANLASAVWIQSFNSSHINSLSNFKLIVVLSCVESSISKNSRLLFSYSLWQNKTLDSVSLAAVPRPGVSQFREFTRGLSGSVDIFNWQHNIPFLSGGHALPFSDIIYEDLLESILSRYCDYGVAADRVIDVHTNHPPLKTCSEPRLSRGAIVGITLGALAVVMSHARCLYNAVFRKKKAEISSALLRNEQLQLMPVQGSESSGALAAGLAEITVDKAVEFSYEELSKATNDFSFGNKIGQGGFGAVYYAC